MTEGALGCTLTEITSRIHHRELSPVELMDAVLDRIARANPVLNAVVCLRDPDDLRREAREAEARVAAGAARPLEGIPLGVKDLEDVEGLVTSHGSLPFRDNVAQQDSVQVRRLKAAGAIVIGKTNAPEFGYTAITKNLVYGVTRSPWNPERTPGGSSGGSSAAIAGLMLPLVTASDGGGSVRLPASFAGCFGLKTSYGRIPYGPATLWDYGETAVHGPLTKTVEDAALFMDMVVGHAPEDPKSLPHPGISYREAIDRPPPRLRIAYSPDLGGVPVQPDIAAAVAEAVQVFRDAGHDVFELQGGPPPAGAAWGTLGSFELAAQLHEVMETQGDRLGHAFAEGLRRASRMDPQRWGEMSRTRAELVRWCRETFDRADILITPTTPIDPPPARGPFPAQVDGRPLPPPGVAAFTIPFNLSWQPAASVPVGFSEAGLPIGMQIVGPWHRDDLVLQVARLYQRERPWHPHWPALP